MTAIPITMIFAGATCLFAAHIMDATASFEAGGGFGTEVALIIAGIALCGVGTLWILWDIFT